MKDTPRDPLDVASETSQRWLDQQIAATRADIVPGEPGDCAECGEHSERLVDRHCARCRDELGL